MTLTLERSSGPDLLDPTLHGKPWLARTRADEAAPVFWNAKWRAWCITGYPEMVEALRDPRFSIAYNERKTEQTQDLSEEALKLRREFYCGGLTHLMFGNGRSLLVMDAPEHTPFRRLLQPHFTEREVSKLEPAIETIVASLLDQWTDRTDVEIMSELAYPLPVLLFGDILGIPQELRAQFIDYSAFTESRNTKSTLTSLEDYKKAARQGPAFAAKIDATLEAKRKCPGHDILTTLIDGQINGEGMPEEQLRAMFYLLNTGSQTTTAALIGNCVYFFLHFGLWDRLRADPSLLPAAVEETLRFDPPASYVGREATEDFEFHGCQIKKGETVLLFFAPANRDPREFKSPDEFIHDRAPNRHFSFGIGSSHFCLGAPVARREAVMALRELMRRFPSMSLSGEPEHANAFGFAKLTVSLGERAG